jgi:geranylgeranyl reductase family protein
MLRLRSSEVKALVIDRPVLDRELMQCARDAGAEVRLQTKAISAHRGHITLEASGKKEDVHTRVIIGADGPASVISSWFGLPPVEEMLMASQATVIKPEREKDEVDVYFGRLLAPGFFAWIIPAQEGIARVGIGAPAPKNTNALLSDFLLSIGVKGEIERVHGMIPICLARETVADGLLLVGDAAGQVKPLSGGGLYTGFLCAKIAGQVAAEAALAGKTTRDDLVIYQKRFRREISEEIIFGRAARSLLLDLSDEAMDAMVELIDREEIMDLISSYGDIDYPSRLVHAIMSRRDLWPLLGPVIGLLGGMEKLSGIARKVMAGGVDG